MKQKFIAMSLLLLFSRGCDFYSTSLWFFDHPEGETNPLSSVFGVGFTGLVLVNVIIIGLIIYAFYYYSHQYRQGKPPSRPTNLKDYISERYYNEKGKFYNIFFKTPTNKKTLVAHLGYVLVRVVIVASFLATFHNLCQFYQAGFYNTFRDIVGRPLFVIYGLILVSLCYFTYRLWKREFEMSRDEFDPPPA